ncbi:aspartyl-phosphate phosphatase Spo0E family protein [Paenibacillus turicensis]|uniref:Spo0E family sporulation regulatory protein-aspartic acid phosphatase n=1 Tax=Paenibacillus turicensis TaxID=160487 RepID=UPI003D2AFDB8
MIAIRIIFYLDIQSNAKDMIKMDEIKEILQKIEELRQQLNAFQAKQLTDPEVIKISTELDQVLNEYQRMLNQKKFNSTD